MSKRFGRDVRLRARAEFTAVQDNGRRVSSRFLTLLGMRNGLGRDRLGVIASRRLGGAVVRNRAKRRLREIFRQGAPDVIPTGQPSLDLVAIARRDLALAPFAEVRADVRSAITRLRRACA
jgi:ribonuclease P protein component